MIEESLKSVKTQNCEQPDAYRISWPLKNFGWKQGVVFNKISGSDNKGVVMW